MSLQVKLKTLGYIGTRLERNLRIRLASPFLDTIRGAACKPRTSYVARMLSRAAAHHIGHGARSSHARRLPTLLRLCRAVSGCIGQQCGVDGWLLWLGRCHFRTCRSPKKQPQLPFPFKHFVHRSHQFCTSTDIADLVEQWFATMSN